MPEKDYKSMWLVLKGIVETHVAVHPNPMWKTFQAVMEEVENPSD